MIRNLAELICSVSMHSIQNGEETAIQIDGNAYKVAYIKKILDEYSKMEQRMNELEKMVLEMYYRPGGEASEKAKQHWESCL